MALHCISFSFLYCGISVSYNGHKGHGIICFVTSRISSYYVYELRFLEVVQIINYLDETWTSKHAIVGLFVVHETSGSVMVLHLQSLLEKFGLISWVIVFVKDEGNNLGIMVAPL